jgi:hypothetical protein
MARVSKSTSSEPRRRGRGRDQHHWNEEDRLVLHLIQEECNHLSDILRCRVFRACIEQSSGSAPNLTDGAIGPQYRERRRPHNVPKWAPIVNGPTNDVEAQERNRLLVRIKNVVASLELEDALCTAQEAKSRGFHSSRRAEESIFTRQQATPRSSPEAESPQVKCNGHEKQGLPTLVTPSNPYQLPSPAASAQVIVATPPRRPVVEPATSQSKEKWPGLFPAAKSSCLAMRRKPKG